MRFALFEVAGAATVTADGLLNTLDLGVGLLRFDALPAQTSLALVGIVRDEDREFGGYRHQISVVGPSGTETVVYDGLYSPVDSLAEAPGDRVQFERVPTGYMFAVPVIITFAAEGTYAFRTKFSSYHRCRASTTLEVRLDVGAGPEDR